MKVFAFVALVALGASFSAAKDIGSEDMVSVGPWPVVEPA